nr:peptidoglycan binding domain-containing protein [Nocardioides panaciterrulae]
MRGRATRPITVSTTRRTLAVSPVRAGLGIDYAASVDQAATRRSWRPAKLWQHYSGGSDLDPVMSVDETRMAATVARLNRRLGTPARDGALAFHGDRVQVTRPRTGHQLDPAETAAALEAAFVDGVPQAQLTLHDVAPVIDDADLQRARNQVVNPALSGSVRLLFGATPVRLQPRAFTAALRLVARDGRLVPRVDAGRLARVVGDPATYDRPAVDATVRLADGRISVVPPTPGVGYRADDVARAFGRAVRRPPGRRTARVAGHAVPPRVTARDARAWRVRQVVATASARTRSDRLGPAVQALDGAVLAPGRTLVLSQVLRDLDTTPGADRLAGALGTAGERAGLEVSGDGTGLRLRNPGGSAVLLHVTIHGSAHGSGHRAGPQWVVRVQAWSRG